MVHSLGLAVVALSGATGVGLVFLTAGLSKFRHSALLPGVVANYRLLPPSLVAPVAAILPIAEILIGAALILGIGPLSLALPAVLAMLLLGLFAAAMAINIGRGRTQIDCGCGRSQLRHPIGWGLVARNMVLMGLLAPRLLPAPVLSPIDLAAGIAGGLAIFLAYVLFNSIGALIASPAAALRR
ncbi:methylamine utilization protein MauE [Sphingobium sp. H39-3-25]|uniref:MauE/DoxX family redox-associated membrane protein n=1 Tax=Sphingobium arseniciresistens TaxID=3030834 RepID=UPI0023B930E4|nr:methylamine utilization protein MauE [Sphingobium arseniciresistens]